MPFYKLANDSKRLQTPAISKAVDAFLQQHRLQGHTPILAAGTAMHMHGLRDDLNDVDLFIPGMKQQHLSSEHHGREVDAHNEWLGLEKRIINNAQTIHGMKVMAPQQILETYRILNRPKDQPRIAFLEKHLEKKAELAEDGEHKRASAVRSRLSHEIVDAGNGLLNHSFSLMGKPVGTISVRDGAVGSSIINKKFRGMGLGKKMYGEVLRRTGTEVAGARPTLRSDAMVSEQAARVWKGMPNRPGYQLRTSPNVQESIGYSSGLPPVHLGFTVPTTASGGGNVFEASLPLKAAIRPVIKTAELAEDGEHKLQGHIDFQGLDIAVENRKGSVRSGKKPDGGTWRTEMKAPYGYIEAPAKGKDGESIDAYVGPKKDSDTAFVVHQHKPDGTGHDEDKVILGVESKEEAKKLYLQHYDSPKFLGPISTVPVEKLKEIIEKNKRITKLTEKAAEVYMKKYVGTHVKVPMDLTTHVDPEAAKYRAQKFGEEHHVTLLTPDEIERLKKKGNEPAYIKQVFDSVPMATMSIKREPMVFDTPRRVYNVLPVTWPEAQKAREQFGLRPSNLHVTVGATEKKISDVQELKTPEQRREAAALERKVFAPSSPYQNPRAANSKKFVSYGIYQGDKLVAATRVEKDPKVEAYGRGEYLGELKKMNPEVFIKATAVAKPHRGQGLAQQLREHLKTKYDAILTGTEDGKSDPAMHHINQAQGFQKVMDRNGTQQWFWSRKGSEKLEKVADMLLPLVRSRRAME